MGFSYRTAIRIAAAIVVIAVVGACARVGLGSPIPAASPTPSVTTQQPIQTAEPSQGTAHICPDTIRPAESLPPGVADEWDPRTLQGYVDSYGVSHEEAVRRFVVSDEVETLMEGLRTELGARMDTFWIEHEPEFRLVTRVINERTRDHVCDRVAGWPILVAVESGSAVSYADLERGFKILSDMFAAGDFPFTELSVSSRSNSLVVAGPDPPSDAYLEELSELAGVPVAFELMPEQPGVFPLLPTPSSGPGS